MSKEANRLMGHPDEADGIDEYDNPLPDWWLGLFWLTIVWAIGYGVHYHFIAHRSQEKALAAEMAAADARWPAQAAAVSFAITPDAVSAGERIFQQNCVACHGAHLEGGIGPTFLDEEWLHGGQAENIIRTITNGVSAKGMVPWGGILSPEQINQVAAFVIRKHSDATGRAIEDILQPAAGDSGGGEG